MRDMNDDDITKLIMLLIRIRIEVLEQTQEMGEYVKNIGHEQDKVGAGDMNTKEIAYVEFLSFECTQLN